MTTTLRGRAGWLDDALVKRIFAALAADGGEARVVGGAVRNALLDEPVSDIDFATTHLPDRSSALLEAAGFRVVPTGIDHGTVMAVADGRGFEITTLRADIATDGRHAEVRFGVDWKADAERRDFTINALYCRADGAVVDDVGGLADIGTRTLRFIGQAETRITEDYLRILRFFRFFAQYGAGRPDGDGLRAVAKLKSGLDRLSAERIWTELKKLFSAEDPSRALLWMRQTGVLTVVLPETDKWGIDAVQGLVAARQAFDWPVDPILLLEAVTPPDEARRTAMATRLKVSTAERERLVAHAMQPALDPAMSEARLEKTLYRGDQAAILDHLRIALASRRAEAGALDSAVLHLARLAKFAADYRRPTLPVSGKDLIDHGISAGPELGHTLRTLETLWVDSGFALTREALLARL